MGFVKMKDKDSSVDYMIDWTEWLSTNETIASSAWTLPTGLTEDNADFDDDSSSIMVSGGSNGVVYSAVCTATTNQGRTVQRRVALRVEER